MIQKSGGKKYYNQIDALKGFAIFLVILGHSIILKPVNLQENMVCKTLYDAIYTFHMPLFFLVSGFCFSYSGNYIEYLKKKDKRIAVPYLIFNLLDMLPRQIFASLVNRPRTIGDSVRKMLLLGGEYWFLYTLFVIFLFYPLVEVLVRKWKPFLWFFELVFWTLAIQRIGIKEFELFAVSCYLIYFHTGRLLREYGSLLVKYLIRKRLCWSTLLILSSGIWYFAFQAESDYWMELFLAMAGISISCLLADLSWFQKIFQRFGKYSLQMYLLNGYFLVVSRAIICSALHVRNPLAIIGFNILIDFGLSYLFIKYILDRFRIFRVIMGSGK